MHRSRSLPKERQHCHANEPRPRPDFCETKARSVAMQQTTSLRSPAANAPRIGGPSDPMPKCVRAPKNRQPEALTYKFTINNHPASTRPAWHNRASYFRLLSPVVSGRRRNVRSGQDRNTCSRRKWSPRAVHDRGSPDGLVEHRSLVHQSGGNHDFVSASPSVHFWRCPGSE